MLRHNLETVEATNFGCLSDLIGESLDQILIDATTKKSEYVRNEVMLVVVQLGCDTPESLAGLALRLTQGKVPMASNRCSHWAGSLM